MPNSVDIQGSPQRAKGQMDIDSYFKSPHGASSKHFEEKKGLLSYVKKVSKTSDIVTETEKEPQNDNSSTRKGGVVTVLENKEDENLGMVVVNTEVNENRNDVHEYVNENKNGVCRKNCKGKTENIDQKLDTGISVTVCKELKPNLELSELGITPSKILDRDIGISNENHKQSPHNKMPPVNSVNNKLKLSEVRKMEKKNIFAIMMANRGSQNEVLDEMAGEEKCDEPMSLTTDKITCQNPCKKCEYIEVPIGNENECSLINKDNAGKLDCVSENKANNIVQVLNIQKSSHVNCNNVFAFMMANRHKQDKVSFKNENLQGDSGVPLIERHSKDQKDSKQGTLLEADTSSKGKEINLKRKRKKEDLDSSLQDFDIAQKPDSKKKRKYLNKKFGKASEENNKKNSISSEMLHEELENSVRKDISINNCAIKTVPGSPEYVTNSGSMDSKVQEISSSCVSISFTDFLKEVSLQTGENNLNNKRSVDNADDHEVQQAVNEGVESRVQKFNPNCRTLFVENVDPHNKLPKENEKVKGKKTSNIEESCFDKTKIETNESIDVKNVLEAKAKTQVEDKPQKKRSRKKINTISDSDDDSSFLESTTVPRDNRKNNYVTDTTGEKESYCNEDGAVECSKKNGISKFFQKLSQEERATERSKNVFTVKADVHAPYDGLKVNGSFEGEDSKISVCDGLHLETSIISKELSSDRCAERSGRRLSKRIKKNKECEDLNKIELLEQITITSSPKKSKLNSLQAIDVAKVAEGQENQIELENAREEKLFSAPSRQDSTVFKNKEKKTKTALDMVSRKVVTTLQDQNFVDEEVVEISSSDVSHFDEDIDLGDVIKKKSRLRLSKKKRKSMHEDVVVEEKNCGKQMSAVRRSLRQKKPILLELKGEAHHKTLARKHQPNQTLESSCDTSSDSLMENDGTKGIDCSSPEMEDDKENYYKYTSTLIHRSDRLRLRIKRIHHPLQHTGKTESLSLQTNNKLENHSAQKKAKKLLQKAKRPKRIPRAKKLSLGKNKKNVLFNDISECMTKENAVCINMAFVEHDVIDEAPSAKGGKIISSKWNKRRKSTQVLLKPLQLAAAPGEQLQKSKCISQSVKKKNKSKFNVVNKNRRSSRQAANVAKQVIKELRDMEEEEEKTIKDSRKKIAVKDTKLAPIFCKKSKSPPCVEIVDVVTVSPAKLKARQDFLQSGVPDEIKKQVSVERSQEEELNNWPPFPEISHTQQKTENEALWNLSIPTIPLRDIHCEGHDIGAIPLEKSIFEHDIISLLDKNNHSSKVFRFHVPALNFNDIVSTLAVIKIKNPSFPVYRVFKSYYGMKKEAVESYKKELEKEEMNVVVLHDDDEDFKGRRKHKRRNKNTGFSKEKRSKIGRRKQMIEDEENAQQNLNVPLWQERTPDTWTQVFAPKNGKHVIGNAEDVKRLKIWLQEWKTESQVYANKEKRKKRKMSKRGDDCDESDESSSWDDENDLVNTYLLSGPPGIGKTTVVYALAAELGYKVLEVNASSRRPGRQVMSQLAEATQSHSLSNSSSAHPVGTVAAMFAAKMSNLKNSNVMKATPASQKKDGEGPAKELEKRKDVSLVLFEDIDIVFEEWDEGFISTVNSFMATSKRPIILTVNHLSPIVLSRIKGSYEKIEFAPPPEDLIAQHLQLMCLVNGYHVCYKDLESLAITNKGDIRQTILDLQLSAISGSSHETCLCGMAKMMNISNTECENILEDSKRKDLTAVDIFPKATNIELHDVKLYTAGFCDKIQAKAALNERIFKLKSGQRPGESECVPVIKGDILWTQIADNLSCFLPFPLKEQEKKEQRYPLKPDDPHLKTTSLWQRNSWLSLDDEEEAEVTQPETMEMEEANVEEIRVPKVVQTASKLSLNSLVDLYNTFTQLDVLECSLKLSHTRTLIKDRGWWVQQPTAGLSDEPDQHPHWAPFEVMSNLTHELGHRALIRCNEEIGSTLREVSPEDMSQLCVNNDSKCRASLLQCFSPNDSERNSHWAVMASMATSLPPVNQLSRSIFQDYFPTLRSIIRHDELGVALSKKRRGRRFLCQLTQLGFDISVQDKLKMANAMIP